MNLPHETLANTMDCLRTLIQDGVRPDEARRLVRRLQASNPGTQIELLWEEEAYDRSVHYDALLHFSDEIVSLSLCNDGALPWPMRGARRWSEQDLLRVNNTVLSVQQAVALLDFIWDSPSMMTRLVEACLIQEAMERDPVDLSQKELQEALDRFRKGRGLFKAEEARRWMEEHGITHQQLEHHVADDAKLAKLRDRVATADRVEDYFESHHFDFDSASFAVVHFTNEQAAFEAYRRIRDGRLGFYEAAECAIAVRGSGSKNFGGGLFRVIRRGEEPKQLGAAVFAAQPGDVVGPIFIDEIYTLVRVLTLSPARLDAEARDAIKGMLFAEWLAEKRRHASIEWNWGDTARTSGIVY